MFILLLEPREQSPRAPEPHSLSARASYCEGQNGVRRLHLVVRRRRARQTSILKAYHAVGADCHSFTLRARIVAGSNHNAVSLGSVLNLHRLSIRESDGPARRL